jgi:hypothetical protein
MLNSENSQTREELQGLSAGEVLKLQETKIKSKKYKNKIISKKIP